MPKRSITDEEIGLIKAMLARGMANKDIQFYFNRQDRAVNSGRVTGIKSGAYGPDVPRASDAALETFLAKFATPSLAAPTITAVSAPADAMDEKLLRTFFTKDDDEKWFCRVGETDEYECKEGFNLRNFGKPLKTIAGFANHRGGYLFFGVKDKPDAFAVCGLADDRFATTDQNKFSQAIRSALEPTPRFRVATLSLDTLAVGVIHVEAHAAKPVIARKAEGDLSEGVIYFRYPGETRAICYADLRAILDQRDRQSRSAILPAVQRLLELGPENAMVVNLADALLEGGERPIIVDQRLIDRIKFIREGMFDEREGAETLRLIGDVTPANVSASGSTKTVRSEVTEEAIIRDFVRRAPVDEPLAYVRQASHEQSFLLPIFYYLHLAGQSRADAIAELKANRNAKPKTAKEIIRRLRRQHTLLSRAGGKRLIRLGEIRACNMGAFADVSEAKAIMDALTGITEDDSSIFDYANGLVGQALDMWATNRDLLGLIRKAASRLDELIFGPMVRDS